MRHLPDIDDSAALRRGQAVEQFLGRSPANTGYIRLIKLRPSDGSVEVWVYDVEDIGNVEYPDLYSFPYLEPDGPEGPVASFQESLAAVQYATSTLAADPARWVNIGVGESEYIDYVRAGRPTR